MPYVPRNEGVRQGSVLRPVLFLFVNDLEYHVANISGKIDLQRKIEWTWNGGNIQRPKF